MNEVQALVLLAWGLFLALAVTYGSKKHSAWVLLGAAISTILLGWIGFFLLSPITCAYTDLRATWPVCVDRLFSSLFLSIQQLFMEGVPETGESLSHLLIRMSHLAAIATIVTVALEAVRRVFEESIQRLVLRWFKGHVVICGLGSIGYELVRDLRTPREAGSGKRQKLSKVVVIEPNRENDYLDSVHDLGALVVHGDATETGILRRLSAQKARDVFFVTGQDEVNVEGACELEALAAEYTPRGIKDAPSVYLHLRHADLGNIVENRRPDDSAAPRHRCPFMAFNVIERSVQNVVSRLILPWRPSKPSEVAHFVIVGFGEVGQRLAVRLAELAHFENFKRSRMTIVHSSGDRDGVRRFCEMYPRMMPSTPPADVWMPDADRDDWSWGVSVADPENPTPGDRGVSFVVNGSWAEMDAAPESDEFVRRVVRLARSPGVRPFVFICKDSVDQNCSLAQKLRTELDQRLKVKVDGHEAVLNYPKGVAPVPIFSYVPRRPMLTRLVDCPDLISFGASNAVCTYEALTSDLQRELAEVIAADFHRKFLEREAAAAGREPPSAIEPPAFSALPPWERQSSLSAAAHLNIKLAVLGLEAVYNDHADTPLGVVKITPQQREQGARMEHNRWLAERLLNGWTFGERDNARKQRLAIVDWDNLKRDELVKDFDQVDRITAHFLNHKSITLVAASLQYAGGKRHRNIDGGGMN